MKVSKVPLDTLKDRRPGGHDGIWVDVPNRTVYLFDKEKSETLSDVKREITETAVRVHPPDDSKVKTEILRKVSPQEMEKHESSPEIEYQESSENVRRVVDYIRNDTGLSNAAFSRAVYAALRDGKEEAASEIIARLVPTAAKQISVELSTEEQEQIARIILGRARRIQQKGDWERTLK